MKDTIKIDRKNTQMIAHRGLSGIELQNTCAAFVAAGNRSYCGIETDIHRTIDGQFVVFHDDNTNYNLSNIDCEVEKATYDRLYSIPLNDKRRQVQRTDYRMPLLSDYIEICKNYQKIAVLELKNLFSHEDVGKIIEEIKAQDYLANTVFIAFNFENLIHVRSYTPNQSVQFLTDKISDDLIPLLVKHKMDLDIHYSALNADIIKKLHENDIKVNAWTCDDPIIAKMLIDAGIDYLTSNILE